MRTSQRAAIAITVALGTLVVASIAWATPPSVPDAVATPQPSRSAGPIGSTCAITMPNCNDSGLGGAANAQIVEPTPGMANLRPTVFDTATIADDDVTLTITFWSGVEPCSVLDHVEVAYATDAVTVTLFEGYDPSAGQVACPAIAVLKQTTIALKEPLAGRAIVDGASG